MAENESLTPRQLRFVLALLKEPSVLDAARAAGVGEATAWRYLRKPAVREELSRRVDGLCTQAMLAIMADQTTARKTLREVMGDPEAPPAARVSAARAVLEVSVRLFELFGLSERLRVLEEAVQRALLTPTDAGEE